MMCVLCTFTAPYNYLFAFLCSKLWALCVAYHVLSLLADGLAAPFFSWLFARLAIYGTTDRPALFWKLFLFYYYMCTTHNSGPAPSPHKILLVILCNACNLPLYHSTIIINFAARMLATNQRRNQCKIKTICARHIMHILHGHRQKLTFRRKIQFHSVHTQLIGKASLAR